MNEYLIRNIDRTMDSLKKANNYQIVFSAVLFLLGVVLIYISYIQPVKISNELPDVIKELAAAFILSINAFPVKEIIKRKITLKKLTGFRADYETIGPEDTQYMKKLEEIYFNSLSECMKLG